jgi:cellulose biosynthesis protein BcsQ
MHEQKTERPISYCTRGSGCIYMSKRTLSNHFFIEQEVYMDKIQLLLLDEDTLYAERLAAFIRSSEFADKLQTKLFTKMEYLEKLLEADRNSFVLIVSEAFIADCMNYQESLCVLSISNFIQNEGPSDSEIPSLYRFQPLQQLLTRVLAHYKEKNAGYKPQSKKTAQVVSLYSAVGNSGKTLSAVHLSRELAFRGQRVFFLSLESPSFAFQLLQGADPQHFSQLLYYIKSNPELLGAKLELFKKNDPRLGFDFLSPCHHIREAQEMSGHDTQQLIEAILTLNSYDYIVLDLEASLQPRISQALKLSDHILWMVLDDLNCLHKTKSISKMIGSLSNVHYVLNKYTGSVFNDFNSADIMFDGYLPYIPEWKTVHAAEQIVTASIFSDQVMDIFEDSVLLPREGAFA